MHHYDAKDHNKKVHLVLYTRQTEKICFSVVGDYDCFPEC